MESKICMLKTFMKYNNQIIIKISYIDNQIGAEGIKYLSESLKSNNSIQTLDLRGNKTKNKKKQ